METSPFHCHRSNRSFSWLDLFPGRARLAPPRPLRVPTWTPPPSISCWTFPAFLCCLHVFCAWVFSISFSSFLHLFLLFSTISFKFGFCELVFQVSSFEHFSCRWVSTAAVPRAQQSTAQLHKAANQVHADQSTYFEVSKEVCTYNMHAVSGLFSWSMELLAFAGRLLFAPQLFDHVLHLSCSSLPCERA